MDYAKIIVIGASKEEILKDIEKIKDWAGASALSEYVYVAVDELDRGDLMKLSDVEQAMKSEIPEWLQRFSDKMNESAKRMKELEKLSESEFYIREEKRESSGRVSPREQRNRERFRSGR